MVHELSTEYNKENLTKLSFGEKKKKTKTKAKPKSKPKTRQF